MYTIFKRKWIFRFIWEWCAYLSSRYQTGFSSTPTQPGYEAMMMGAVYEEHDSSQHILLWWQLHSCTFWLFYLHMLPTNGNVIKARTWVLVMGILKVKFLNFACQHALCAVAKTYLLHNLLQSNLIMRLVITLCRAASANLTPLLPNEWCCIFCTCTSFTPCPSWKHISCHHILHSIVYTTWFCHWAHVLCNSCSCANIF